MVRTIADNNSYELTVYPTDTFMLLVTYVLTDMAAGMYMCMCRGKKSVIKFVGWVGCLCI